MAYEIENALNQQRRAGSGGGLGAGVGNLALAFMGGTPAHQQNVLQQGALMQDRLAQARQRQWDEAEKQQQRASRRSLSASIKESNPLGAQFLDSFENPEQAMKAFQDLQKTGYSQELWNSAHSPDFNQNMQTRLLEVLQGKPEQHSKVEGDTYFDPYATPDSQRPQTTAVGNARIKELGSLVSEHNAQAERARAGIGADKAGNYEIVDTPIGKVRVNKLNPSDSQPVTMNGDPVAKSPATGRGFTEPELAAAFGTGDGKTLDPVKLDAFLAKKHAQPNASDAEAYASLKDDQNAAAQEGPPKALMNPDPGPLDKLGAMFSSAQPAAGTPYKEGQKLKGPDGKTYIVRNGEPVPL